MLLGIFASGLLGQFVKPVGDALEGKVFVGGALLSLVAYVLYDQVRELTSSVRPAARALVSSTEIGMFVREAFQARRVEIAFLGYTGETLYNALYHRLEDLFDNPGPTRRVSIRMLVPDFGMPMTVPSRVGSDGRPVDDPDFRKRLERRCREYDHVLSGLAERLTENSRVTVECASHETRSASSTANKSCTVCTTCPRVCVWSMRGLSITTRKDSEPTSVSGPGRARLRQRLP